ncbi:MAG: nucleoside monophosphate kinase [Chloroflexi bacterium]|nr:MAG: nucleoside monophosphate kinase [Chloroflexota bacterium]
MVLLGAPGAGKGTQAEMLQERLGLPHVATGDQFREAYRQGTPIGREARRYMDRGQLVPDDITIRMLLDRLDQPDAKGGAILDFPRTAAQARALDAALGERGSRVDRALLIDVPAEDLVRRMAGRWICEKAGHVYHETANPPKVPGICDIDGSRLVQRPDDRAETIRARLAQQLGARGEVVDHYRRAGVLRTVDGRQPIDAVARDLLAELDPPVRV